jgi:nucleotidyltransferase/DNA polymerase involved in DNA repair
MRTRATRIACLVLKEAPGPVLEPLWEALAALTPAVEWSLEDAARFYLDAEGMGARYGDRSNGEGAWSRAVLGEVRRVGAAEIDARHIRLGVANTRFAAQVAAHTAPASPGYRVVSEPDARFLSGQALDWLPLDPDSLRRLHLFGIHAIGGLAALPQAAVIEQLGLESLTAWRWATGQDARPVVARRCQTFTASHLYDEPETRREALVEGASRLAERALGDLPVARPAWAIRRVTVQAGWANPRGVRRCAACWSACWPCFRCRARRRIPGAGEASRTPWRRRVTVWPR